MLIDGLPFTPEGYARASSALTSRFGKPSEVAAAQIHRITSLPVISNCNPNRIKELYKKLTRLDNNWQEWDSCQLVDSLRKWTEGNPKTAGSLEKNFRRENLFQVRDKNKKLAYVSVYCEKPGHSECELVSGTPEHRRILLENKLCFNCTI